jgi:hypothetical protein
MKIYLAFNGGYDYTYPEILGAFTTEEKAAEYLNTRTERVYPWNGRGVIGVELDIPFDQQDLFEE